MELLLFWNIPDYCLKRIRFIEDDILSNPIQIKLYLAWAKLKQTSLLVQHALYQQTTGHQFVCTVCTVQTNCWKPVCFYSMHCTNKLLETSLFVQCALYRKTAPQYGKIEAASPPRLDLSPGGPERGQFTARPTTSGRGP